MNIPTLTQSEVLDLLKISHKKLRSLEEKGRVRVVRISTKVVRYFSEDIEKMKGGVK